MAPKKAAVTVPEVQPPESSPEEKGEKPGATTVRKLVTHPSTAVMVEEAIKALDSRKGVSSQAIQNYIKQTYPSVDLVRLKGLVRRALKKGLEKGTLVRPANATATSGATGRFRLAKPKDAKAKSENVDPNMQKAPKAEKVGAKDELKKKKPAALKKVEKDGSQEVKPAKKPKKDVLSSKDPPVKKPKAAGAGLSETVKPKGKAKAVNGDKEQQVKKPQKAKDKAQPTKSSDAPAKTQGKRGKNLE